MKTQLGLYHHESHSTSLIPRSKSAHRPWTSWMRGKLGSLADGQFGQILCSFLSRLHAQCRVQYRAWTHDPRSRPELRWGGSWTLNRLSHQTLLFAVLRSVFRMLFCSAERKDSQITTDAVHRFEQHFFNGHDHSFRNDPTLHGF